MQIRDKSKRRRFIVTVPAWYEDGRDVTLRELRNALNRSFEFGDAESRAEKPTVSAYSQSKKSLAVE